MVFHRPANWFYIGQSINVTHYIKKIKEGKHLIISMSTGKASDKLHHPFTVKIPSALGIEGNIFNFLMKLSVFPLVTWQERLLSKFVFHMILNVQPSAIRYEKEITSSKIWKEKVKLSLLTNQLFAQEILRNLRK